MTNDEFKKQLIRRAFIFSRKIIALVDTFPIKRSAWVITDQLLRAATSIAANIIEAQAANSKKRLYQFS
jgi:four helix bundle protein